VISGFDGITSPWPWTLDWLAENVGAKRAAVNIGGSQASAMRADGSLQRAGVELLEFPELRKLIMSGESAYLYDCSIPLKLPLLCERVGVPALFAHDWLLRTRHLHAFSRSWPSLFVGAAGTRSSLHIDQWVGHFWMAQLQGEKLWTIFHPDDAWCALRLFA